MLAVVACKVVKGYETGIKLDVPLLGKKACSTFCKVDFLQPQMVMFSHFTFSVTKLLASLFLFVIFLLNQKNIDMINKGEWQDEAPQTTDLF